MYLLDSILTGNCAAFKNAAQHLALLVITLGLINGAAIMKMTHSTMGEVLDSDFIHHARLMGLAPKVVRGYALKNSLPAVLMVIGNIYSYLLGGAVLIEQVFAWGAWGSMSHRRFPTRTTWPFRGSSWLQLCSRWCCT